MDDRDEAVAAFASWIDEALRELRAELPPPSALDDGLVERTRPAPPPPSVAGVAGVAAEPPPVAEPPATVAEAARRRPVGRALAGFVGGVVVIAALAVSVGPALLPYRTYHVRSGSMEPAIPTGALVVLTKADADDIAVGDIITFDRPDGADGSVTHRVIAIDGDAFVTKGDDNASPDPWLVAATGTQWRYAFDVPLLGFAFGWLASPLARVGLVVVAVVGLASMLLRRR